MSSHASQHDASLKQTIGENIRRGRKSQQPELTQRQLATELDTDVMSVSRWERGENRPSAHYEAQLAQVLFKGDLTQLYAEPATPEAA